MTGYKQTILLGAGAALMASAPLASQQSGDAALETACRATEVTEPDSCPCTIEKARAVGVSDAQLASLFKDDGHSDPVGPGAYGRFWQVKAQCIADATMARMGISPSNPLPGVPANMRPGMPLPGSPVTAGPTRPRPLPDNRDVSGVARAPAPKPDHTPVATSRGVTRTVVPGFEGRPDIIEFKRQTPFFDYYFSYSESIESEPALLTMAEAAGREKFAEVAPNYTAPNRSYREEYHYGWYQTGRLGPLLAIGQSERPGSRGASGFSGAVLWDTERDREIAWTDVFDARVWNGRVRRGFCDGLFAQKRERGTLYNTNCPDFESLQISLSENDAGDTELVFVALNGVAGSYAEGPYDITLPVDARILAGVKAPYRDLFRGGESGGKITLQDRLSPITQVLAGEIQASDDFFFGPATAKTFTTVEQFDQSGANNKANLFMTLYEGSGDNWGYSLILDGRQRDLRSVSSNANGTVRTYSDGTVTVTIRKGPTVTNNPAFGYSADDITISLGDETETFTAINFGGA